MKRETSFLVVALALAPGAGAQVADPSEPLRLMVEREAGIPGARVELAIGQPSSRMQLAPCGALQPFVPPGARLWGRTTLGVRCIEGATWQVFLPVHVRIYAPAPVAARALAQGESVTAADVRFEEVELTRYAAGAIADPAQLAALQLARPLAVGAPLLREYFRARAALAQGDTVKLVYSGEGFSVTAEAKALSHALEGQTVRVVTESGRVLTGTARAGRVVQLNN